MIIASHPDDEVLGCGGLINKLKKGADFFILFLRESSTCRYDDVTDTNALEAIEYRELCAKKALKFLEIKNYYFNRFPCGRFDTIPIIEINS